MKLYSALYKSDDPFAIFDSVDGVIYPHQLKEGGVLLLHGGADISPAIYGQKANKFCHADNTLSHRDTQEVALVKRALELNMPIIGICRGAQLLCAMDGGILVQHLVNHGGGNHPITDGRSVTKYESNSAHHQMLKPNKKHNNVILAMAETYVNGYEEDEVLREYDHVPEIVYFPKMNAIGIQGHPEWMPKSDFTKYCASLIQEFLIKDTK